ncbi:MAG: hypothetical protein E6K76_10625 [Candidatus Eisenbacteria bacterium]|uniref:DinB family protein n=1 Tax=Eiseniibacteriota bacterium TaxID=2212470 RepID=A0A538T193_UNCEI|nr:MAG: hypothetical protein E6K76_10625 [Candidatus Eisenbacteria bacterium]
MNTPHPPAAVWGGSGVVPRAAWQNFPTDLPHFLSYFVANEAHHRGQPVMLARQLGTACLQASPRGSGSGPSGRANDGPLQVTTGRREER